MAISSDRFKPVIALTGLFGVAGRIRLWVLPALLTALLAVWFVVAWNVSSAGVVHNDMPRAQVMGTSLMFTLMPPYLLFMLLYQWRYTSDVLQRLSPIADAHAVQLVKERMRGVNALGVFTVLAGLLFGAAQNELVFGRWIESGRITAMDLAFALTNCLLWAQVALLLSWRLAVNRGLAALGRSLQFDLYDLRPVRPLARLATTDVLLIAGALALMPLQSLDAQFRLYNYQWGLIIGVPAAVVLFLVPLLGVRGKIRELKAVRLQELRSLLATSDRADIHAVEVLSAHIERVRGISDWPLDVQLLARIVAYVVIAPLAWVAAALVENLIDQL